MDRQGQGESLASGALDIVSAVCMRFSSLGGTMVCIGYKVFSEAAAELFATLAAPCYEVGTPTRRMSYTRAGC
jgi:hypothetical protein